MSDAIQKTEDPTLRHVDSRERDAWAARYKHRKAAQIWSQIAAEQTDPRRKKLYEQLRALGHRRVRQGDPVGGVVRGEVPARGARRS